MPLRVYGSTITKAETQQKYGLAFFLYSEDDPANAEYNTLNQVDFNDGGVDHNPDWNAVAAAVSMVIPVGITIDAIYAEISTAPGGVASRTFLLVDDGVTAYNFAFIATQTRLAFTGLAVNIAAGSVLSWQQNIVGVPAGITFVSLFILYHIT